MRSKWPYDEHLCEIILNLDQQFKECSYIFDSGCHFVQWSGTVWAILVVGIVGNIFVKKV